MTRILITGGTGVLGSEFVARLNPTEHTIRIMSRGTRPADVKHEWAQADMGTGAGLAEAVRGVDIIINAASHPYKTQAVDVVGTQKLTEIAREAGVKHFFHISIVGIEHIPYYYYTAKVATEKAVIASGIPYSILRATQFHTLPDMFLQPLRRYPWAPALMVMPPQGQFQLIDPGEVAEYALPFVLGEPSGRLQDVGGPEILRLSDITQMWMEAQGIKHPIIYTPIMRKVAAGFRKGDNTCPDHRYGKITWEDWLARKYGSQSFVSKPSMAKG